MDAVQKALRLAKAEGGGSTGAVQGSPDAASASPDYGSFVSGLYQSELGRAPEAAGLKGWVDALQSNAMTQDQVRQGILGSSENQVQDLYSGLLGRKELDPNAYNWVNALESGAMTPAQIREGIMGSEEYKNLNPSAGGAGTTTAGTTTGATTGATPVDITKQGMPLIYTPPPYKDYGATAAAFRVASGLENLPAPFFTLSPVVGGTPSNYNPATGTTTGSAPVTGGTTGGGATGGGTTYQDILNQIGTQTPTTGTSPAQTPITTPKTSVPDSRVSDIAKLYQTYLGRLPEEGAAQKWADAIGKGQLTYNEVVNQIKASPEAIVFSDYQNILGRTPDPGAQGWINAIVSGQMTPEQVRAAIQSSPEAQGLGAATQPAATAPVAGAGAAAPALSTVAAAYQQFLGRAPEPGAAEAWAGAIASGQMTAEQVAAEIANSAEAQARAINFTPYNSGGAVKGYADGGATYEDLVNAAYTDFLGREADPAGFKSWLGALTSGQIAPADFESKFKGAGYEDEVVNAYRTVLDRTPSLEEAGSWNNALTKGDLTLDQVMQRIQKSPEATSRQYYETVPTPDKFSQRQGGRMYDIDIGRGERIPELGRMAAPVNVKQAWENSEIARLKAELEKAKTAGMGTTDNFSGAGGGTGGGAGSNFGGSDPSGTVGGIGQDPGAGPAGPDAPGTGPGEKYGGRINAVNNALRLLKADRR